MAAPCFVHQLQSFPFTPDEVASVWGYAKETYIDKGIDFHDTITRVADDLGLHPRWVAEAFTKPKAVRNITAEIYRTQEARRSAVRNAKDYVRDLDTPGSIKMLKAIWSVPRSVLTLGHYAVFPVTHGGDLLYRPSAWSSYFKGAIDSWKFASKTAHAMGMDALKREDLYTLARRGGLDIGDSGPTGILASKTGGMSRRGWDGLKITRMDLFKREWKKVAPHDQTLDTAKHISEAINHATGTLSPHEQGFGQIGKLMFAPKLTAAKWKKGITDPAKTVSTYIKMMSGKGGSVSAGERAVARMRVRNAAEFMGFTAGMLAINQGLLSASGSKQKINFTDPTKADWLRFKAEGHVLNTRGVAEVAQLLGKLVAVGMSTSKDRRGQSKHESARGAVAQYAQYKIDPTLQLMGELGFSEDAFGRPLPWSKEEGKPSRPKYTVPEYVLGKGPIPLAGVGREIYETLRERGIPAGDATSLMRALAQHPDVFAKGIAAGAFEGVGGGIYKEREK